MKLNPETGQALGAINGPASIDGKQILPLGASASWLNRDTIIYGTWDDGVRTTYSDIRTYHVPTGQVSILIKQGFNFLQAGGNRWQAWLGSVGLYGAVNDELGGLGGGRHGGVSWDGTVGIIPSYQQGIGLTLYAADGRVTEVPGFGAQGYGIQVLGPTSVLWTSNEGIRGFNVNVPSVQVGYAFEPRRCYFPERKEEKEWICYWSNDYNGYVVHPYDKLEGYVLNTTGNAFWPDAIAWKGKIRVAFSWRQGEFPEDVRIFDVDLDAPRTQFYPNRSHAGATTQEQEAAAARVFISGDYTAELATRGDVYRSLVRPQLGLYEDDIVYRLAMLATNVLEPLKKRYPRLVIKSGFREVNGGIGQHERGEAVDIQLANQTDDSLLEMAKWIRDNLPYDQLILNFSNQSRPWIHVSFSPDALRQEVLTKDYADGFTPGLAIVEQLTGEQRAEALRQQSKLDDMIISEMTRMQARETRGGYAPVYGDEVADSSTYVSEGVPVGEGGSGGQSGEGNGSDYTAVVKCVIDQLYKNGVPGGFSNEQKCFAVVCRVAWLLKDKGVGLCLKAGGSNIFSWNGYSFSSQRICFSDGTSYDIIGGASSGGLSPQWNPDYPPAGAEAYLPAIDPGTEINMDWLSCPV